MRSANLQHQYNYDQEYWQRSCSLVPKHLYGGHVYTIHNHKSLAGNACRRRTIIIVKVKECRWSPFGACWVSTCELKLIATCSVESSIHEDPRIWIPAVHPRWFYVIYLYLYGTFIHLIIVLLGRSAKTTKIVCYLLVDYIDLAFNSRSSWRTHGNEGIRSTRSWGVAHLELVQVHIDRSKVK